MLTSLNGVGQALSLKLDKLGLQSVFDLLFHLPARYEDRTQLTPLGALKHGQNALILGQIADCQVQYGRRRSLAVTINDETALMVMRLYYFNAYQLRALEQGAWIS